MDEWIKKMWNVHTHTHTPLHKETLFSHDKEGHPDICNDIDQP